MRPGRQPNWLDAFVHVHGQVRFVLVELIEEVDGVN